MLALAGVCMLLSALVLLCTHYLSANLSYSVEHEFSIVVSTAGKKTLFSIVHFPIEGLGPASVQALMLSDKLEQLRLDFLSLTINEGGIECGLPR